MNDSWINHICKIMSKCHVLLTRLAFLFQVQEKLRARDNQNKVFRVAVLLRVTVTQNFILYF